MAGRGGTSAVRVGQWARGVDDRVGIGDVERQRVNAFDALRVRFLVSERRPGEGTPPPNDTDPMHTPPHSPGRRAPAPAGEGTSSQVLRDNSTFIGEALRDKSALDIGSLRDNSTTGTVTVLRPGPRPEAIGVTGPVTVADLGPLDPAAPSPPAPPLSVPQPLPVPASRDTAPGLPAFEPGEATPALSAPGQQAETDGRAPPSFSLGRSSLDGATSAAKTMSGFGPLAAVFAPAPDGALPPSRVFVPDDEPAPASSAPLAETDALTPLVPRPVPAPLRAPTSAGNEHEAAMGPTGTQRMLSHELPSPLPPAVPLTAPERDAAPAPLVEAPEAERPPASESAWAPPRPGLTPRRLGLLLGALVVACALVAWWLWPSSHAPRAGERPAEGATTAPVRPAVPSVDAPPETALPPAPPAALSPPPTPPTVAPRVGTAPAPTPKPPKAVPAPAGEPSEPGASLDDAQMALRRRLEAKANTGKASQGELKTLLDLCVRQRDAACSGRAEAALRKNQ